MLYIEDIYYMIRLGGSKKSIIKILIRKHPKTHKKYINKIVNVCFVRILYTKQYQKAASFAKTIKIGKIPQTVEEKNGLKYRFFSNICKNFPLLKKSLLDIITSREIDFQINYSIHKRFCKKTGEEPFNRDAFCFCESITNFVLE